MNMICLLAVALKLGAPFTDGMVLQRELPVRVWGEANPQQSVQVAFAEQCVTCPADAKGHWQATLAPLAACGTGRTLSVAAGDETRSVHDVLVGEVWFASGQSNMECPLGGDGARYRDMKGRMMMTMTRKPLIRYVKVKQKWSVEPIGELPVSWRRCVPEDLIADKGWISAVAFYYARELSFALEIPIGIVDASWGGTNIDAWTPRCGYDGCDARIKSTADYPVKKDWTKADEMGAINGGSQQPTVLFNAMVAPFAPMTMRGFIWYQGCHNRTETEKAGDLAGNIYRAKMHALYNGWAKAFGNPNLRLYFAQLAPWTRSWFPVQLGQQSFAHDEPNAGMAVLSDVGNAWDIHPNDKEIVAKRLAIIALKRDYGFTEIEENSPTVKSWSVEGDVFTLTLDHAQNVYFYDDDCYRKGYEPRLPFELAGEDGVWRKAKVVNLADQKKDGKTVPYFGGYFKGGPIIRLRAEGVAKPVRCRYMYHAPQIDATLCSEANLPLGPFIVGQEQSVDPNVRVKLIPGRQMFLNDALIGSNTLKRVWKQPKKYAGNPVLKPETELEKGGKNHQNAMAMPFSDGVWYDGQDGLYKCWYHAGWANGVAYAFSKDGITWTRPKLNENGDNLVWRTKGLSDSSAVIMDPDAKDGQRFKAFNYDLGKDVGSIVMTSKDGLHWSEPVRTAPCGDCSTIFYNPFTKKWGFSLRCIERTFDKKYGRSREYAESEDFIEGAKTFPGVREWIRNAAVGRNRGVAYGGEQLYNFDCVAYESVMIGLAQIMTGPENCYWGGLGLPKMVDLRFGFNATPSDADAWEFPSYAKSRAEDSHHTSFFIRQTRRYGDWDMGYLRSVGGICVVVGDELRFYYGAFAGDTARAGDESNQRGGMYANGAMGFATLRRDGFCAMTGPGELTTKPLQANGRYLFANAAGALKVFANGVEVGGLDGDKTKVKIADLAGKNLDGLTLRFEVERGELYSFWFTDDPDGASGGYLAAGSFGQAGLRD